MPALPKMGPVRVRICGRCEPVEGVLIGSFTSFFKHACHLCGVSVSDGFVLQMFKDRQGSKPNSGWRGRS
jgi:hypothetical protein